VTTVSLQSSKPISTQKSESAQSLTDKAYVATKKANTSGSPDDHKIAVDAHEKASIAHFTVGNDAAGKHHDYYAQQHKMVAYQTANAPKIDHAEESAKKHIAQIASLVKTANNVKQMKGLTDVQKHAAADDLKKNALSSAENLAKKVMNTAPGSSYLHAQAINHIQVLKGHIKDLESATESSTSYKGIGKTLSPHEFESMRTEHTEKLSEKQLRAFQDYSGDAYKTINKSLAKGGKELYGYADHVKHMDEALNQSSMSDHTTVYRGVGIDAEKTYGKLKVGDHYIEPRYSSTSAHESTAFHGHTRIHITIPKGGKGIAIPSWHPNENEIVIPRNQRFRVDHIEHSTTGKRIIHVTALHE